MNDHEAKLPSAILTLTRRIFAASHWTTGALQGQRATEVMAEDDRIDIEYKPVMCSVGALRYAALAPMEHALDSTWIAGHLNLAEENIADDEPAYDDAFLAAYATAVIALAEIADPGRWKDIMYDRADEETPTWELASWAEDVVIDWNDSLHYHSEEQRLVLVNEELLPVFDQAIATLVKEETARA